MCTQKVYNLNWVIKMSRDLIQLTQGLAQKQAADELLQTNEYTQHFGLTLTNNDALALVQTRYNALNKTGRIEFGAGITGKIIKTFCNSPYVSQANYARIMGELTDIFYEYKNETIDLASDDELIGHMKNAFDGVCQGSLELLSGRELYLYARHLRFGRVDDDREEFTPGSDEQEDYE